MRFFRHKGLAGCVVATVSLAFAGPTLAASHNPKGEYAPFSECPLSIKTVTDCVWSVSKSGAFKVGSRELPLINHLTLTGGFEGSSQEIKFYGAENGETLLKTAQPLAGFLESGIPTWWPKFLQQWLKKELEFFRAGVTATVELTGPTKGLTDIKLNTESLLLEEGTALRLPVKINLSSEVVGSNCHIGSDSEPIELHLTSGHSGSLRGEAGALSFNKSYGMSTITGGKLVDGTYAVPKAEGCGGLLSYFIDPLINSILGLPSPAGKNTAMLEGKFQDAHAEAVKASE